MEHINTDICIIGAGGAGLSAAITIAENNPKLKIAIVSKVYPMRSHTVAAEGGAAAVRKAEDCLDFHFHDTVAGGDWLSDQDAVELFVEKAPEALAQLERWGCPWSRQDDGTVATRSFGGMKKERTWFAADKSGFHILHTLYQTSLQHPSIQFLNEYYVLDLITSEQGCHGAIALELRSGKFVTIAAKAVIMATGGAGKIFPFTTNAGTNTADGMAMAYRAGVPLKDIEFVQYHPTALPNTGILITEAARGEGGILVNKDNYRYLQDYALGPAEPFPRKKAMELGPRDKLSQAFWQEAKKGNTVSTPWGAAMHLDLRHLGEAKINERLPMVRELAQTYINVDPVHAPIPVRPAVHYTMGGIHSNIHSETPLAGLYAAGECACVSINGANRLGSNSLTELMIFGKIAGDNALGFIEDATVVSDAVLQQQAKAVENKVACILQSQGDETAAGLYQELLATTEAGLGIYRDGDGMQASCDKIQELRQRFKQLNVKDKSKVFNTELSHCLELASMLEVAEAMAHSALNRKESRGSHQRLDGYEQRDDENFLKHSLAYYQGEQTPTMDYLDVVITKLPPAERVYGKEE